MIKTASLQLKFCYRISFRLISNAVGLVLFDQPSTKAQKPLHFQITLQIQTQIPLHLHKRNLYA